MTTVSIDDAQANLPMLLDKLSAGEEIVITKNNLPIGRLVGVAEGKKRQLGSLKGTVTYVAPDFDAPLDDFLDYVQ